MFAIIGLFLNSLVIVLALKIKDEDYRDYVIYANLMIAVSNLILNFQLKG